MTSTYQQGVGWCETGQARLGGSPWERRDAYIENSPFFYLDRVRTPLLIIAGTDDRIGTEQAEETFTALRRLQQRVEIRSYTGENHSPVTWSEPNLKDLYTNVLGWFDKYLKD